MSTFEEGKKTLNRKNYAYQFYLNKGLRPIEAAAIVGNLDIESGGFSDNVIKGKVRGDSGTAFGIAQWRGDRQTNLQNRYKNPYSLDSQLNFVLDELQSTHRDAYNKMKKASSVEEATSAFTWGYERPNPKYAHFNKRVSSAANLVGQAVDPNFTYQEDSIPSPVDMSINMQGTPINLETSTTEYKETEEPEVIEAKKDIAKKSFQEDLLEIIGRQAPTQQQPAQQQQQPQQNDLPDPYNYIQQDPGYNFEEFQEGGKVAAKDFLVDWYTNRRLPDEALNEVYQKEKPLYIEKAKTIQNPNYVDKIGDDGETLGFYHKDTGAIDVLKGSDPLVYTHEASHAINMPLQDTKSSMTAFIETGKNIIPEDKIQDKWIKEHYKELSNYNEVVPRLNSYRQLHGLKPDQVITPELIKTNRESYKKGTIPYETNTEQLYKMFEDEGLSNVLNKIVFSDTSPYKHYAQEGGSIPVSENGVYEYPMQEVIVPTQDGRITMSEVDYPIVGISMETGEQQLMMPEGEYAFQDTKNVFEIPQFQNAGTFNLKNVYNPAGTIDPKTGVLVADSNVASSQTSSLPEDIAFAVNLPDISISRKSKNSLLLDSKLTPEQEKQLLNVKPLSVSTEMRGVENAYEREGERMDKQYTKDYENKKAQDFKDTVSKEGLNREELYKVRRNDLDVTTDKIDINNIKNVKAVQRRLVDAGYNLNPEGKFKNNGIDGKIGKITRQAIEEYNNSGEKGSYTPFKSGEGELGKCREGQCSEYAQNELFRNMKPNVSRALWNEKTGLTGDAWRIGKNVVKAGGKEINSKEVRPGDIITMYTGGDSPSLPDAMKYGTDATHVGVVDKVNPDGSYYILHNLHQYNPLVEGNWEGHERRDLVKDGHLPSLGRFAIRKSYRPDYSKVDITGKSAKVRNDIQLRVDPSKIEELQQADRSKVLKEDMVNVVKNYTKPLNDINNKRVLAQKHGLTETEYQSVAKAALGILGQESGYDTSAYRPVKQAAATALDFIGLKDTEASKGASQIKYNTNYGNTDITELGINKSNFTETKNIPLVTFDLIAKNYRNYVNKGETKEKALYKAIEKYNKGRSTKLSEAYDSDYVNKVMGYANMFNVEDAHGGVYNTIADNINKDKRVIEKQYFFREKKKS